MALDFDTCVHAEFVYTEEYYISYREKCLWIQILGHLVRRVFFFSSKHVYRKHYCQSCW